MHAMQQAQRAKCMYPPKIACTACLVVSACTVRPYFAWSLPSRVGRTTAATVCSQDWAMCRNCALPAHCAQACNYRQAAFCYEELLMINPGNSNYYVRYADVLYTLGGAANFK